MPNSERQIKHVKAVGCEGVVFPTLINDADITMGDRFMVRDHAIYFPYLKGTYSYIRHRSRSRRCIPPLLRCIAPSPGM